jgi:tetratricopeptide (TPR) repeat protein
VGVGTRRDGAADQGPGLIVAAPGAVSCEDRVVSEEGLPHPNPDRPEPDDDRESAYELLRRGEAFMRTRHPAQAAVVLQRAADLEPRKASILEALGRAYFNSAQHDRSRETFEALLEIDPSSHYAHFALGQSLKKLGREQEAWTHLRLAVALEPGSSLYRSALARIPNPRGGDEN